MRVAGARGGEDRSGLTTKSSDLLQDLNYRYDPVGNALHLSDEVVESIFTDNWEIDGEWDWTYDPLYRLIRATGRERDMPNGDPASWVTADQFFPGPAATTAQRNYTELFAYDGVGNFTTWQHTVAGDSVASWTRTYAYEQASSDLDSARISNRLASDTISDTASYLHDNAGNMTRMPHLPGVAADTETGAPAVAGMAWNHANQLVQTYASNSAVTRYAYDSAGQRVRKVFGSLTWTEAVPPVGEDPGTPGFWTFTPSKETVYLPGGYEVVRNLNTSGTVLTEWQMLAVMDDRACVARIETKTVGYTGSPPAPVWRYQLENHLGSSCLEVSDTGSVISREEYYAYGGTAFAWQASGGFAGSVKRYRYSGKECDSENGLYYFGARYYASWIGRWTAGDPTFHAGRSTYEFCNSAPTSHVDPDGRDPKPPMISVGRSWAPLDTIRSWNRLDAKDWMSPKTSVLHKIGSAGGLALGVVAETIASGLNETRVRTADSGQLLARATIHAQRGQYNAAVEDASIATGGFAVGFVELAQNFVGASSKGGAMTKQIERAAAPVGKFANALKDKIRTAFSTGRREAPTVTRGVDSSAGSEFIDDALRMEANAVRRVSTAEAEELSAAAAQPSNRQGYTKAGTALHKKTNRAGTSFPPVKGDPAAINAQAQTIVDEILTNPESVVTEWNTARYGPVLDIQPPGGRGVRYTTNNEFITFLEPPR